MSILRFYSLFQSTVARVVHSNTRLHHAISLPLSRSLQNFNFVWDHVSWLNLPDFVSRYNHKSMRNRLPWESMSSSGCTIDVLSEIESACSQQRVRCIQTSRATVQWNRPFTNYIRKSLSKPPNTHSEPSTAFELFPSNSFKNTAYSAGLQIVGDNLKLRLKVQGPLYVVVFGSGPTIYIGIIFYFVYADHPVGRAVNFLKILQ